MHTAFQTTPTRSAADARKLGSRDLELTEPLRRDRATEPVRFDLLNALLPEWPAQACSWA